MHNSWENIKVGKTREQKEERNGKVYIQNTHNIWMNKRSKERAQRNCIYSDRKTENACTQQQQKTVQSAESVQQ